MQFCFQFLNCQKTVLACRKAALQNGNYFKKPMLQSLAFQIIILNLNPQKLKVVFWIVYSTLYCSTTTNFDRLYIANLQKLHNACFSTVIQIQSKYDKLLCCEFH